MRKLALTITSTTCVFSAFGVFSRWLQNMTAFEENGLYKSGSFWGVALMLLCIAAAAVLYGFALYFRKNLNLASPPDMAAALKQVPSCEFFPMEAVKTNVFGTDNVLTAAIDAGVKAVICLSTDKAAYPVNAMGTSKAMMEKVIVAKSRTVSPEKTKICCTRYGNVMCSRGSVIPLWIDQIKAGNPITITEPNMTRFIMSLEEAVDLVLFAFQNGVSGDILVQKAPACTIETLAKAVTGLFAPGHEIKVIGIRHGEKMYETLLTNEECAHAIDLGNFYRVPCDKRDLNYDKYFKEGDTQRNVLTEFNSNNTELLNVEQVQRKLLSLSYIREELEAMKNK